MMPSGISNSDDGINPAMKNSGMPAQRLIRIGATRMRGRLDREAPTRKTATKTAGIIPSAQTIAPRTAAFCIDSEIDGGLRTENEFAYKT